ncbi:hypothetical protein TOPH_02392 [Tolypocladium ophioglossoides CBS 100239]|uniref:Nephrocystin 3-like N-terminal domain-containing protein n=1 Tax=Tolypocladium ophioglossoides (strain CBS 100239) TaxID=1163406 RepID=A0A0L0NGP0_TOLOC|nr:hypothetical protein TOPH_02392 [Tolypocladium ophioglossoides CBS 100239]
MGFGKTVAMAFLIDELRRQNKHTLFQPKVCYHYCKDDETGKAFASLKQPFWEWYKQALASGIDPATSFKKLDEWFLKIAKTLDRPLVLDIDGLDECDRTSRNTLLKSLRNLSENTPRLKLLLSSRPQEEILEQLSGMAKIILGADAKRDRIIVEKAVELQLSQLPEDVKGLVTDTLSCLAQGSGIWVKMTVDFIESQKIRALRPMRSLLSQLPLPTQLSELYSKLFFRYTEKDPDNQGLATAALRLLAISRRPLSILEIAWAAALGSAKEAVLIADDLDKLVDHLRVMDLIQPFVVRIDYRDIRKRQVILAHQSVKEFVIQNLASIQRDQSSPALLTSEFSCSGDVKRHYQQETMKLEAFMLNICIQYLLLGDFDYIELFSDEHMAIEELPQDVDLFGESEESNDYDPYCTWEAWEENMIRYDPTERGFGEIFVYAACHWIEHFGAVSDESLLPDLRYIEKLCRVGSTRLHSWITQNCRPDCTIKSRYGFDSSLYDPLSITCLYGSETMLQRMLDVSGFNDDPFLPNAAMSAADQILQWGDLSRLRLLFKSNIGHHLQNLKFCRLIIRQWTNSPLDKRRENWTTVFDLIDDMLDIMIRDRWGSKLLHIAMSKDCSPIICKLKDNAQHMPELKDELSNRL